MNEIHNASNGSNGANGSNRNGRRILASWKEIAQYLGRGVRTVQRYESQLGMPVHRPAARAQTSVVAFSDELDQWLRRDQTHNALNSDGHGADDLRIALEAIESGLQAQGVSLVSPKMPAPTLSAPAINQRILWHCEEIRKLLSPARREAETHSVRTAA